MEKKGKNCKVTVSYITYVSRIIPGADKKYGVCSARIGRCLKWLQSYMGEQLETINLQVTDVVSNSLVLI